MFGPLFPLADNDFPAEQNLKKQGLLPLTFSEPENYDRIQPSDTVSQTLVGCTRLKASSSMLNISQISISGLATFAPDKPLTLRVQPVDGEAWQTNVNHTFTDLHISWFKAGSALGTLRAMDC